MRSAGDKMQRLDNWGPRVVVAALVATMMLGLLLRLWGITFGYPYVYHYDEPSQVDVALRAGRGVFGGVITTTGFANLLLAIYAPWIWLGHLAHNPGFETTLAEPWPSLATFDLVLLGRLSSAYLGVLTIAVVYRIGRELGGRAVGLLAAGFISVAFLHVRVSHYCLPDIAATFFVAGSIALGLLAVRSHDYRLLWLGSATSGFAVATKWTTAPVILGVASAAIVVSRTRYNRGITMPQTVLGLAATALSFGVGFAVGGFQLLLDPLHYRDYLAHELRAGAGGGFWIWQVDTVPGWIFYLRTLAYGLGFLPLAAALAGLARRMVVGLRSTGMSTVLLFSFVLPYYVAMGSTRHYFARYALPLFPFLALFAAEAACALVRVVSSQSRLARWWLAAGLALLSMAQPLASSVRHGVLLTRTDTRTIAKEWIEHNIPPGAKFALDWPVYSPPLSRELYVVREQGGLGLAKRSLHWYRQESFDYLVTSNFVYGLGLVDSDQAGMRAAFYASLDDELELVAEFSPYATGNAPTIIFEEIYGPAMHLWQRQQPGPLLRVYRVR